MEFALLKTEQNATQGNEQINVRKCHHKSLLVVLFVRFVGNPYLIGHFLFSKDIRSIEINQLN